jgi:hypothetical protein
MQRYRYTWFLLSLIAMITLAPITERGAIADVAHQILFTSIVLLALNAATQERGRQVAVAVCAVSWLIMDWFDFLAGSARFRIPAGIAFFCLLFVMLYELLTQLLRVRQTDFDLLSAGVAGYFLLGVAWAASFDVIETLWPGSFRGVAAPQWSDYLYFSMGTLTSVGYGDITPSNSLVGIWATLEAAGGVLYIAVLISLLVNRMRD